MVTRPTSIKQLNKSLTRSPSTALLGPRQCGKTTIAKEIAKTYEGTFFDLESEPDRARLQNPELVLSSLKGLIILDEIQQMPELFKSLRVLIDQPNKKQKFLLLGSASPDILKSTSETLAGRIEFVELSGFNLEEIGSNNWQSLWVRGGFPRSYLQENEEDTLAWREGFIRTFLERDIPQLGINIPARTMRRFWTMIAHYNAQNWNASAIGKSMGMTNKTIRNYLDILTETFMVRQLEPWFENIKKRQIKSPKVYIRDTGILHSLLDIPNYERLLSHPKAGASWEGFAIEQILHFISTKQAYFWRTHDGAELDLLLFVDGKKIGFEIKLSEAPKLTKSMKIARDDLSLDHLFVICPTKDTYPIDTRITVFPLTMVEKLSETIKSL